jgi:predicted kinase
VQPTLVVVSGPPGSGKTTLAHRLAAKIGCPAICRDEIKEGMVHAVPGYTPSPGDSVSDRTLTTFFDVLGALVRARVTVVAEAAFRDRIWRPNLVPLADLARVRIILCTVDPEVARARMARRVAADHHRAVHDDRALLQQLATHGDPEGLFEPISLPAPTLQVDTTGAYEPDLRQIVAFVDEAGERG